MSEMKEVSAQLMKSPKELASWNFPLSQILEQYFTLLPEPCKIHFGEAALVIQNSVNAYVRRVEELYDETRCFNQKIVSEEKKNEKKQESDPKSKHNLFDFSQFELSNLKKSTGVNITLKKDNRRSVKFLYSCFTQLDSYYAHLVSQILDIHGEVIGKKYNFRCNQLITKNGTLVNEYIPAYFESMRLNPDFLSSKSNDIIPSDAVDFDSIHTIEDHLTDEPNQNSSVEEKLNPEAASSSDELSDHEIFCNDVSSEDNQFVSDENKTDEESKYEGPSESTLNLESNCDNKRTHSESHDTEIISEKPDVKLRRSKRFKYEVEETDNVNTVDTNLLQPVPFQDGIPQKTINGRKEFRLPCNIKLLTHNSSTRRSRNVKRRTTPKKSTTNSENIKIKTSPSSIPETKEENAMDSDGYFDNNSISNEEISIRYEPVLNEKNELLGFRPDYSNDHHQDLPCFEEPAPLPVIEYQSSIASISTQIKSNENDFKSSENDSNFKTSFKKLVKYKIKQIHDELNIMDDEDQKVAKWHQELKPRLLEAERKVPFSIQEYKSRIIGKLKDGNRKVNFEQIVHEQPPGEIARYFSAILQLASTNNVDINATDKLTNDIEVILLD